MPDDPDNRWWMTDEDRRNERLQNFVFYGLFSLCGVYGVAVAVLVYLIIKHRFQ